MDHLSDKISAEDLYKNYHVESVESGILFTRNMYFFVKFSGRYGARDKYFRATGTMIRLGERVSPHQKVMRITGKIKKL